MLRFAYPSTVLFLVSIASTSASLPQCTACVGAGVGGNLHRVGQTEQNCEDEPHVAAGSLLLQTSSEQFARRVVTESADSEPELHVDIGTAPTKYEQRPLSPPSVSNSTPSPHQLSSSTDFLDLGDRADAKNSAFSTTSDTLVPYMLFFCAGTVFGVGISFLVVKLSSGKAAPASPPTNGPSFHEAFEGRLPSGPRGVPHTPRSEQLESMHLFWPRCSCLIALMLVQSLSSLILDGFQQLLKQNEVLVVFLTMVVGTGGNVGGQSTVMAVRKLALGGDVEVLHEVTMAMKLGCVLAPLAFARCWLEGNRAVLAFVVACAVAVVCILAAAVGSALPKVLFWSRVDPAHATPTVQVGMDIIGVLTLCLIGKLLLGPLVWGV